MKHLPLLFAAILWAGSCARYVPTKGSGIEPRAASTRDRYDDELLRSEVGTSAAYTAWSSAGRRALRDRLTIRPSFRELLYFAPDRPTAVGYRLELRRGQRVRVDIERRMQGRVFAEIFEEIGGGDPIFRLVRSGASSERQISFEAVTDGAHVLRLQPELFRGGEVIVTVTTAAALTFPVLGKTSRAIQSWFGDPRDGGAREHEGIDIFASAGTDVVAVASGVITGVHTTRIGGKVVWQRDESRSVEYYYAHLKTQSVRVGDRVNAGDVVGTVGNTGNARTTPPHLHFAVYRPGRVAINPVPFLYDQPSDPIAPLLVDLAALGETRTAVSNRVALRREPARDGAALGTLNRSDDLHVMGGVRDWYRVRLDDGQTGFVLAREVR